MLEITCNVRNLNQDKKLQVIDLIDVDKIYKNLNQSLDNVKTISKTMNITDMHEKVKLINALKEICPVNFRG